MLITGLTAYENPLPSILYFSSITPLCFITFISYSKLFFEVVHPGSILDPLILPSLSVNIIFKSALLTETAFPFL